MAKEAYHRATLEESTGVSGAFFTGDLDVWCLPFKTRVPSTFARELIGHKSAG